MSRRPRPASPSSTAGPHDPTLRGYFGRRSVTFAPLGTSTASAAAVGSYRSIVMSTLVLPTTPVKLPSRPSEVTHTSKSDAAARCAPDTLAQVAFSPAIVVSRVVTTAL